MRWLPVFLPNDDNRSRYSPVYLQKLTFVILANVFVWSKKRSLPLILYIFKHQLSIGNGRFYREIETIKSSSLVIYKLLNGHLCHIGVEFGRSNYFAKTQFRTP